MKKKIATVTLELSDGGIESIEVVAVDAASREAALEKLRGVLPWLELLEDALADRMVGGSRLPDVPAIDTGKF